ncbi:TonB-dependent receptor [Altererythrobacter sp. H2]|uniref:TonB-dependent receptor plug domain-containing protein n=1 Tax=Altererythrobacter sp. H2 TaxID=3108391 RepID=UPI002B4BFBDC|nr:TonB-dependent receptor [Altererythrobacter sp. H2]WRK95849.1 TonB-dependent receptor [Altererythrobacter sp. H2]
MSQRHSFCTGAAAFAIAAATLAAPAMAQDAGASADNADDPLIIVTGTRRTDRTIADSAVPIDVIGSEALLNQGSTETNRLLNNLVPSFNFPQPSLTDGTDSLRPATLRGLAPDQVLVLVNGKRRHLSSLLNLNGSVGRGSAGVDMNTIPPLAIDRIEVLRDGAASQYGSDAIAGVINIQLKKREGGRAQASFGKYITEMDGVAQVASVSPTTGASDNPAITFTGEDRKRRDGDTYTIASNIGLPVGATGYLNLTAEYKDRSPTNRSGADLRRQYVAAGDPREATIDRYSHRFGDGESKDFNFFVNAGADLGDSLELYAFGSYGVRDGNGAGFYRRSNDPRNRDWSASTTTFIPIYPDGFLPLINSEIRDKAVAGGIRGESGEWNFDLSINYGSNTLDYDISNTVNTSLGGAASARKFYAGGLRSGQTSVNLDVQRAIDLGIGETSLAFGGEWRNENYKIVPGELGSYVAGPFAFTNGAAPGAQVFPGFSPSTAVDASRDSFAVYLELDTDISEMLNVQVAGRYENFSDFGGTLNGKLAARLEPVDGLAFRGSISTGFRAPGMAQQFFSATSTNNVNGTLIEVGTFPVGSPIAVALGAEPLEAEKSVNIGGGLVFNMIPRLSVTVDYYNIKINDRITLTENLQGADVVALLQAANVAGTSARFFINGIDTRTQGVDVVASYRMPDFGIGAITLTAGYNINDTEITDRRSFGIFGTGRLFARPESFRLTDGQPSNKLNIGLDWEYGPVGLTARANRYGSVFLPGTTTDIAVPKGAANNDLTMSPETVVDLEVRFNPIETLQLAVGANNLLDQYPDRLPFVAPFGANNAFLPYSSQSPFGFSGRFVYGRVSVDF